MRTYEFTVIFDANEDQTAKGLDLILAEFKTAQVQITKQEDMGVRNLAYPIRKQDKGHYYYFELEADPSTINGFNNTFKLMLPLLKFLFVHKSDNA